MSQHRRAITTQVVRQRIACRAAHSMQTPLYHLCCWSPKTDMIILGENGNLAFQCLRGVILHAVMHKCDAYLRPTSLDTHISCNIITVPIAWTVELKPVRDRWPIVRRTFTYRPPFLTGPAVTCCLHLFLQIQSSQGKLNYEQAPSLKQPFTNQPTSQPANLPSCQPANSLHTVASPSFTYALSILY